jgi:hypothetical protein
VIYSEAIVMPPSFHHVGIIALDSILSATFSRRKMKKNFISCTVFRRFLFELQFLIEMGEFREKVTKGFDAIEQMILKNIKCLIK